MTGCRVNGGDSGSLGRGPGRGTRKLLCNGGESRSRMSLTVDAELRELIGRAKAKSGSRTASKAIQWALKQSLKVPPSATLGYDIIKWAENRAFQSENERRELSRLVAEMYKQLR